MRIAVTGASGFIGGHLIPHLEAAGHQAVPLRRDTAGSFAPSDAKLAPTTTDLADHMRGVDAVIHLAVRQQDSPDTPLADYLPSNVALTEHLLQAVVAANVSRFVLASSRLVYPSWINVPATEDCPHPPDTFYGLSKRIGELLVAAYSARHGIRGSALRVAQVFGPGDKGRGVLPRFIETARKGHGLVIAGQGVAVRDFVYVQDVVRAFRLAVESTGSPPVINIGGGRGYSINELATAVADAAGMDLSSIVHLPVAEEDTSHYSLDCDLARVALDWSPAQSLQDVVAQRLAAPY